MNNSDNPRAPEDVGKTFVEGSDAKTGFHSLGANARLDATSARASNPYAGPAATEVASNLPSGSEPIPLGSGTIVGLLGSGGMAKVYKVWNEKLEVFRAVKILIPNQQGDLRNRFETEAKITAKLHHPNIVEIYNVGDWQGLPYLEMEIIDGLSLEAIIAKTGKLPPAVCSAISIFVARALAYAHGQQFLIYGKNYHGIVHRDLKPANIMVSSQGGLKLMDFGIARPTEASLHTVEGNIVGTMQYLAPEQMDGADIDARADLYAFGAILYEILTGTKTFPQETITNLMKRKILNEYRKFDDFEFDVPSGLAKISQKCLQIDKTNRFADANTMLKELESVHRTLSSESPEEILKTFTIDPGSIAEITNRGSPLKLSPKIIIAAASAALVAILIAVFVITGPKPAPAPPQEVKAAQPTATPSPVAAAPTPPSAIQQDNAALKPLDAVSSAITTEFNQKSKQEPEALTTHRKEIKSGQSSRLTAAHTQTSRPAHSFEKSSADPSIVEKSEMPPLARLQKTYESSDFFLIGKMAMQKSAYSDAILALATISRTNANYEKAQLMLANAYLESGRLKDAQAIIQNEKINDAEYYFLAGKILHQQGRHKEALDYFQSAVTKPSNLRSSAEVRSDALYYTALVYRDKYISDPSPDNRGLALQAWLVVKNIYRNNPNSPRYQKAVEELANTK
jgi:serine/threonine-protein kinase